MITQFIEQKIEIHPATYEFKEPVSICMMGSLGAASSNNCKAVTISDVNKVALIPNNTCIYGKILSTFVVYRKNNLVENAWLIEDAVALKMCCTEKYRYTISALSSEQISRWKDEGEKSTIIYTKEYAINDISLGDNPVLVHVTNDDYTDSVNYINSINIMTQKYLEPAGDCEYFTKIILKGALADDMEHKYYFTTKEKLFLYLQYEHDNTADNEYYILHISPKDISAEVNLADNNE